MSKWLTLGVLTALKQIEKLLKDGVPVRVLPADSENFELAQLILPLRQNLITDWEDTFVYNLNSKFVFGKFKENELRQVWKVAPDYVEWCLINADGFIVEPEDLKKILNEPVIELDYLNTLITEIGNRVTIDLRHLPLNAHGFRVAPMEESYELSEEAISSNKVKLAKECHPLTILKGSNWGDDKALIRLPRRSSVVIYG